MGTDFVAIVDNVLDLMDHVRRWLSANRKTISKLSTLLSNYLKTGSVVFAQTRSMKNDGAVVRINQSHDLDHII